MSETEPLKECCDRCQHVNREGSNPYTWLCELFPQDRRDPMSGGWLSPYHRCRDVLRLSMPNDSTPCGFFSALPEVGEPQVTEARGEKRVTFPDKETVE